MRRTKRRNYLATIGGKAAGTLDCESQDVAVNPADPTTYDVIGFGDQ